MEITGRVKAVFETKVISPTFRKRDLVVTTEEQYPQHILVEFIQDKADLLDSVKEGDSVKVAINIRGREWQSPQGETKYFNSIHGWKLDVNPAANNQSAPTAESNSNGGSFISDDSSDDLPF
mgnify:CR=1 FL=1|jgi:translation initiation factor IF-3